MKKEDLVRKLTSRKFWVAVAGFAAMLIMAAGGTESQAGQTSALIMAGASVIAYIIGEGLADSRTDAANIEGKAELIAEAAMDELGDMALYGEEGTE